MDCIKIDYFQIWPHNMYKNHVTPNNGLSPMPLEDTCQHRAWRMRKNVASNIESNTLYPSGSPLLPHHENTGLKLSRLHPMHYKI